MRRDLRVPELDPVAGINEAETWMGKRVFKSFEDSSARHIAKLAGILAPVSPGFVVSPGRRGTSLCLRNESPQKRRTRSKGDSVRYRLWQGQRNLVAVGNGQVRRQGPVPKIVKLVPVATRLFLRYESRCSRWAHRRAG